VWQQKAGRAIEAWDCEVYALHASRARRVHLMKPTQWEAIEQKLQQEDLFAEPEKTGAVDIEVAERTQKRKRSQRSRSRTNSFKN
jgi:phage terminase large subunit GpA-like protein